MSEIEREKEAGMVLSVLYVLTSTEPVFNYQRPSESGIGWQRQPSVKQRWQLHQGHHLRSFCRTYQRTYDWCLFLDQRLRAVAVLL